MQERRAKRIAWLFCQMVKRWMQDFMLGKSAIGSMIHMPSRISSGFGD